MKRAKTLIGTLLIVCVVFQAAADAEKGRPIATILNYEYGQNRSALSSVENTFRTASSTQRTVIEKDLTATLSAPEATRACKQFVCRMLRICGTEKCVPALAPLLIDKDLSHMARYDPRHATGREKGRTGSITAPPLPCRP